MGKKFCACAIRTHAQSAPLGKGANDYCTILYRTILIRRFYVVSLEFFHDCIPMRIGTLAEGPAAGVSAPGRDLPGVAAPLSSCGRLPPVAVKRLSIPCEMD